MSTITGHTTRATGTVLTAAIYNADHNNHVSNAIALNTDKLEGATPPVVDGHGAVFSGTSGAEIKTLGRVPGDMNKADNLSGLASNATAFSTIKQAATETATGVTEQATTGEVRSSATGNLFIRPQSIEEASAAVALDNSGATIALDWDTGINFTMTMDGNYTLSNPTNGQPGTWRTILFTQDGTGNRTLAFGNQYRFPFGENTVLSTAAAAEDRISIFCRTASIFEVYGIGIGLAT